MRSPTPRPSNVSVQVWYNVGSKDDPKGRSGFAHMFEHLMFKATRNLVSEQMDRLTEDVGGYNNASTDDDYTNYYEVVPANHLQRLLFAEADRMAGPGRRARPISPPNARLWRKNCAAASSRSPTANYSISISPKISLQTSSLCAPRHRQHRGSGCSDDRRYSRVPRDLLSARQCDPGGRGQFRSEAARRLGRPLFRGIKKPDRPIPRVRVAEPERTRPATYTVYEPNTPLPAVLISYPVPADNDRRHAGDEVLNAILSAGEHSRLYDALVYQRSAGAVGRHLSRHQAGARRAGRLCDHGERQDGRAGRGGAAARKSPPCATRPSPRKNLPRRRTRLTHGGARAPRDGRGQGVRRWPQSVIIDGDPHAADKQLAAIAAGHRRRRAARGEALSRASSARRRSAICPPNRSRRERRATRLR